jgi:hypothetical protein
MKFRYAITYAKLSPDVSGTDAVKGAFDEHIKEAEKHGLKVPFWGSPWGTSEDIVIVYEFARARHGVQWKVRLLLLVQDDLDGV